MKTKIFVGIAILGIVFIVLISGCTQPEKSQPEKSPEKSQQQPIQDDTSISNVPSQAKCGNNQCESGESSSNCCLDCGCPSGYSCEQNSCKKIPVCGYNQCESGEDSSNCCLDCGCPSGYSCDRNSCKKIPVCGNGILEEGETSGNCCIDAGCQTGQTCQNNKCIELKPEIGVSLQTTGTYSATYFKANGIVGNILLSNAGNDDAFNVKVVLSSPDGYFSDETLDLGRLPASTMPIIKEGVHLNFLDKVLDVTTDESASIKATITFSNSANKQYNAEESFNIQIAGRNYMTWSDPKMVASWVTSTQPTIREFASKSTAGLPAGMSTSDPVVQAMAARWLFESMRSYGVRYVSDPHSSADYVQFPIETLKNKAGDCDDNAVLYASLLEAIGLKSFLMLVPGHIFAGYIDSEGYAVSIETTASDFDSATQLGIGEYNSYRNSYTLIYPASEWINYPQVNLKETAQLNMPSITKQIWPCEVSFNLNDYFVASVHVKFVNSGNAPGAGCAAVATYQDGQLKDRKFGCWTLNPGETKEVDFQPNIDILSAYTCNSY